MLKRMRRAAATLIPPVGLILLLILGNAFARVFLSETLALSLAAMSALIFGAVMAASRAAARHRWPPPPVMLPLALLVAAAMISTVFAHDRVFAITETALWLAVLLIFWAATFLAAQRV